MKNEKIFNELASLAVVLGQPQQPERLKRYVEILKDHDLDKIIKAIRLIELSNKFFPQPVEILQKINPPEIDIEDQAGEIAGEIFGEIKNMNVYDPFSNPIVFKYREIIQRMGGVEYLCSLSIEEGSTANAQIRRAAKSWLARRQFNDQKEEFEKVEHKNELSRIDFNGLL